MTCSQKELEGAEKRVKELQDDLAAVQFTPHSKHGKLLMAKCRTLQEENSEIGREASEGKVSQHGQWPKEMRMLGSRILCCISALWCQVREFKDGDFLYDSVLVCDTLIWYFSTNGWSKELVTAEAEELISCASTNNVQLCGCTAAWVGYQVGNAEVSQHGTQARLSRWEWLLSTISSVKLSINIKTSFFWNNAWRFADLYETVEDVNEELERSLQTVCFLLRLLRYASACCRCKASYPLTWASGRGLEFNLQKHLSFLVELPEVCEQVFHTLITKSQWG